MPRGANGPEPRRSPRGAAFAAPTILIAPQRRCSGPPGGGVGRSQRRSAVPDLRSLHRWRRRAVTQADGGFPRLTGGLPAPEAASGDKRILWLTWVSAVPAEGRHRGRSGETDHGRWMRERRRRRVAAARSRSARRPSQSRMSVGSALAGTRVLGDHAHRLNEKPGLSIAIAASGTAQL